MATKAALITALGGALLPLGPKKRFTRTSGNILTSAAAHGLQTGAGPFKVTTTNADAPAGITAAVPSSTFVTADTVIATDAIVIDGKTYTFVATPSVDGDVDVGASDAATMENLARAVNLGPSAGTAYAAPTVDNPNVFAESVGDTVVITAKSLDDTVGDAIEVSTPDATLTWDNATLEGGASGTDYYVIVLSSTTFSLATSKALAIAGTAVALTDAGTGAHFLVPTVQTFVDHLEDVLVNRLTYTGLRVRPAADAIADFWQACIDGVGGD